jgi:hypothetical protein
MPTFLGYLAIYAGTLILGEVLKALRPKPKPQPFEYPTADEDVPIPMVYGTGVVAPNIIAWGDTETADAGDHTAYYARMIGGLCYGPLDELVDVVIDGKSLRIHPQTNHSSGDDEIVDDDDTFAVTSPALPIEVGDGTVDTIYVSALDLMGGREGEINASPTGAPTRLGGVAGVMRMHWGTTGDDVDALTEHLVGADKASGWPGIAYLTFGADPDTSWTSSPLANGQWYWGLSPNLPTLKVVVRRFPHAILGSASASRVGDNANAAEVIYDLLTSEHGAQVPASLIDFDAFETAAELLADEPEMGVSLVLDQSRAIREVIDDICRHVDATVFRHPVTGKISITVMRAGDASVLTVTTANSRNAVLTPPTVDDTTNEVRVAYRKMEGSTAGEIVDEIITTDYQRNGVAPGGNVATGMYIQLRGRNVSNVDVYNETQAEAISDAQVIVDAASGIIYVKNGGIDDGDTLSASYTASPTDVGLKDSVTAPEHDLANIELTGSIRADVFDLPYFPSELAAKRAAQRVLRKVASRLEPLTIEVNRQGHVVKPGDIITVTLARFNLAAVKFRVSRVTWGPLEDGWISVEAVRDVFGTEDQIDGLPGGSSSDVPTLGVAPAIFLGCVSPGSIRVGLFPADTNFTITLQRADNLAFTTNVTTLSSVIAGTTTYYDDAQSNGVTKYYRAWLTRTGYTDGPVSAILSCTGSAGTPGTPTCTIPTYTKTIDSDAGTVTLVITDPQVRVSEVRYRTKAGNAAWSAWTVDTSPYVFTVSLVDGLDSIIEWEIDYTACDGSAAMLTDVWTFIDPETVAETALVQTTDSVVLWAATIDADEELVDIKTGRLAYQYSLDGSSGWDFIDGVDGPYVSLETSGMQRGAWIVPEAGFTSGNVDVALRVVTVEPDGTVAVLANSRRMWKYPVGVKGVRIGSEVKTAGTVTVDPIIENVWVEFNAAAPTVEPPPDPEEPDAVESTCNPAITYPVQRALLFWGYSDCGTFQNDGTGLKNVDQIDDHSGLANHLSGGAVSGAWVRRLNRAEDASAISAVNGFNPIQFRDAWLQFPTDLFDGVTEGEMFHVIRADNSDPAALGARDYFHQLGPSDDARLAESTGGGADTGRVREDFGSTVLRDTGDFPGTLDGWFIYNVRATAGHYSIYKYTTAGGAQVAYSSGTNTVSFSAAPRLGNRGQNSDYLWLSGAIHSGLLTTDERASVIATFLTRYAI